MRAGQLSPRELLDACLRRTDRFDGSINGWVRLYPDVARAAAVAAEKRIHSEGSDAPLICGLPLGLKDLFAVKGLPLTAGSRVLAGNVAAGDASVWSRLSGQGAVLIGHTRTYEFALAATYSTVANPWNTTKTPSGSSSGSAAVVAARFAPLTLGTDTGGSARIPASICGVSSIKPTFGRISTYGVIPLQWTRDTVGVMGRSLADASLLLSAVAGPDPKCPVTTVGPPVPAGGYPLAATRGRKPLSGIRLGIVRDDDLPASLHRLFDDAVNAARGLGATTVSVSLPKAPASPSVGDRAEVGAYHRQFAAKLGLYEPQNAMVFGPYIVGQGLPVADYFAFIEDRRRFQLEYNRLFTANRLDAIVVPGALDDGKDRSEPGDVRGDVVWANDTGAPVVTIPVGISSATGLPFGVQIASTPWRDTQTIQIGLELQEVLDVWRKVPVLAPKPGRAPAMRPGRPGRGPDPTNTINAMAPITVLPIAADL